MKYFISILLLSISGLTFSQIKLEGYVKDSIGNPLELANVIAINKATSALDSYGITNDDGKYRLDLKKKHTVFNTSQLYWYEIDDAGHTNRRIEYK